MADALKQFLEECKFRNVSLEHKYWDKARVGEEKTRRVPDILATHPTTGREYVIDCRIFWNTMSDSSSGGYASYTWVEVITNAYLLIFERGYIGLRIARTRESSFAAHFCSFCSGCSPGLLKAETRHDAKGV